MFSEEFIKNLPSDPIEAAHSLCEQFQIWDTTIPDTEETGIAYVQYLKALGAYEAFADSYGLSYSSPGLVGDRQKNVQAIRTFFNQIFKDLDKQLNDVTIRSARDKYALLFGGGFSYEFSDGDLDRVQLLLNELRDLVTHSELFDAKHKDRILRKLESLQAELHKKVSSLDRFWGLIGDAGVALGKFGNDAKPFVDRIREISQIVWATQSRAEELPSSTPLPLLSDGKKDVNA